MMKAQHLGEIDKLTKSFEIKISQLKNQHQIDITKSQYETQEIKSKYGQLQLDYNALVERSALLEKEITNLKADDTKLK